MKTRGKYIVILLFIVVLFFAVKISGFDSYLNIESLKSNRESLSNLVSENYFKAVLIYIFIYIVAVILSIPGATVITLAGGFMFGALFASLYINLAATTGSAFIFLLVRYFLGEKIQKRYGIYLEKFNKELSENGKNYFLTVRFIPIFPFFLINILAGLTKIDLKTFVWTTSIGIFPGSLVYAYAGSNLKNINTLKDILSKEILLAFILLGILALIPSIFKKIKAKMSSNES